MSITQDKIHNSLLDKWLNDDGLLIGYLFQPNESENSINCDCGGHYTPQNKHHHLKSKIHLDFNEKKAIKSDKKEYLSKATYQMDIRNIKEAMREIEQDITEGADMIMVKPGMPYLDVIREASGRFDVHIFAYQVSGEYSMLKIASEAGSLEWEKVIVESLISFKRAGASGIFTYAALEVADMIK